MTCRESGIAASTRLGITDSVEALNVDNAVTLRLLHFDREQAEYERKMLAQEVCRQAFGSGDEDEVSDAVQRF